MLNWLVEPTLSEGPGSFNSGNLSPCESSSHTSDAAGGYTYSCMLHLPVVGHVTVSA